VSESSCDRTSEDKPAANIGLIRMPARSIAPQVTCWIRTLELPASTL